MTITTEHISGQISTQRQMRDQDIEAARKNPHLTTEGKDQAIAEANAYFERKVADVKAEGFAALDQQEKDLETKARPKNDTSEADELRYANKLNVLSSRWAKGDRLPSPEELAAAIEAGDRDTIRAYRELGLDMVPAGRSFNSVRAGIQQKLDEYDDSQLTYEQRQAKAELKKLQYDRNHLELGMALMDQVERSRR